MIWGVPPFQETPIGMNSLQQKLKDPEEHTELHLNALKNHPAGPHYHFRYFAKN